MSNVQSQMMLPEFDREMARTRRILVAATTESLEWSPGEGLHTIGWNANHIADIVGWTNSIIEESEFDMAPPGEEPFATSSFETVDEIVAAFDKSVAEARDSIESVTDEQLTEMWSLKAGGETLFTIPKGECVRTWVLNHTVHHRGILSVYLRMQGIEHTPPYDA